MTGHGLADAARPEAGMFLSRLVRLSPTALVRLCPAGSPAPGAAPGTAGPFPDAAPAPDRPFPDAAPAPDELIAGGAGAVALWARVPWDVLVARRVSGEAPAADVTVSAGDLLRVLAARGTELPPRRDAGWRWPLPTGPVEVVEVLPEAEIRRLGTAAAQALRDVIAHGVGGQPVGERKLRDTLLDHVAVTVTAGTRRFEIRQRLVQGLLRTGLLGEPDPAGEVPVVVAGGWLGLGTRYGTVWRNRRDAVALWPHRTDQADGT